MTPQQLQEFKSWFDRYVAGFYADDDYVNSNLKLKEDHSRRVCEEMLYLAGALNLTENDTLIAETIAILHDIGRFKQFAEYSTYNDARSTNHCRLGVEILRETKILSSLPENDRLTIEKAINLHGVKTLPPALAEPDLRFCRLIRDADKLDVFYVAIGYYESCRHDPSSLMLELEFPDQPVCTPEVVDAVMSEQAIDYTALQTLNDMILCQLGWVYDINFAPALRRIKEKAYLETLITFLPRTEEVARVREKVLTYTDSRLRHNASHRTAARRTSSYNHLTPEG